MLEIIIDANHMLVYKRITAGEENGNEERQ